MPPLIADGAHVLPWLLAALACVLLLWLVALSLAQGRRLHGLRLLAEQARTGADAAGQSWGWRLADSERAVLDALGGLRTEQATRAGELATRLAGEQGSLRTSLADTMADGQRRVREDMARERDRATEQAEQARTLLDARLRELRESNEARLGQIERTVNEQLHQAVERQMTASFARVIDQFAAVQKAMGDVQAVTSQIGDIQRLFSNVKTRGGWGEAQVHALLDDMLPPGSYERGWAANIDSAERVDFAVRMPMRAEEHVYLPIDAKFPVEDYQRLLDAAGQGDAVLEDEARRGLARAIRVQARSIAAKYIKPPRTVEFAVLYVPTDGLYAELARTAGLIEQIGRDHNVMILGPSLLPGLLRTVQLGQLTLQLEQKSDEIRTILGATKTEMLKMDGVLEKLSRQAAAFGNTIHDARTRTRAVGRTLRAIAAAPSALPAPEEAAWDDATPADLPDA